LEIFEIEARAFGLCRARCQLNFLNVFFLILSIKPFLFFFNDKVKDFDKLSLLNHERNDHELEGKVMKSVKPNLVKRCG
jgi:hypothetical protein